VNPRNIKNVAVDVLREAVASKYLIVLFGLIFVGLAAMAFALDLEVVNGAISAGKLFGGSFVGKGKTMGAGEFLGPVLAGLSYAVSSGGLLFLIVAVADIAPKMLAPGRVELLLALPLRRTELVIGIYCGVVLIACLAALLAIGGASLVLFVKVELVTPAPLMGALTGMVGFCTVYGVMLAVAAVARSVALSAGAAIIIYIGGVATSDRALVLSLIKNGFTREVAAIAMGPLPRFVNLAEAGADAAVHKPIDWSVTLPVIGGCTAFGLFFVVLACIVVNVKDY
jgi:Cu-processing system permease protein